LGVWDNGQSQGQKDAAALRLPAGDKQERLASLGGGKHKE
jgi:hypothetical protein